MIWMCILTGVPIGIGVRRETLPIKLRALSSSGVIASLWDPGEDLVPKPSKQMETSVSHRAGGSQHGARRGRCSANDSRSARLPPTFPQRQRCFYHRLWYFNPCHAYRKRKSSPTLPSCIWRISVGAELSCIALLSSVVVQRSLLLYVKYCLIISHYCWIVTRRHTCTSGTRSARNVRFIRCIVHCECEQKNTSDIIRS